MDVEVRNEGPLDVVGKNVTSLLNPKREDVLALCVFFICVLRTPKFASSCWCRIVRKKTPPNQRLELTSKKALTLRLE